jgi:hypothetical protein
VGPRPGGALEGPRLAPTLGRWQGGKARLLPGSLLPRILATARPPPKGKAQLLATERPSCFVRAPGRHQPRRHVLPGPGADRWLLSSATAPDASFPTTCFARIFPLLQLLFWRGPLLPLGQVRGPLESSSGASNTTLGAIPGFSGSHS